MPHSINDSEENLNNLCDLSQKDKIWDQHKFENDCITDIFYLVNHSNFKKWAERTDSCANWLDFEWSDPNLKTNEIFLKLFNASFCRVRTCPICQWRKSLKHKARLLERLPVIETEYTESRWLFLTLTVRNCEVKDLQKIIKSMNYGFRKLKSQKKWKALGWIKTIEVTRGADNSAHPHFHILLDMPNSYFGKYYLSKMKWVEIWKKCMKLSYAPNIDIRTVKPNISKGKSSLTSVIAEIAKYTTKPKTFIDNPDWFVEYAKQIHQMRLIDTGGSLRGILSNDYEDLIHIDEEKDKEDNHKKSDLRFKWDKKSNHYQY